MPFLRASSITVLMTSRVSWASCSRLRMLPWCYHRGKPRRKRKVKSKVLKVRSNENRLLRSCGTVVLTNDNVFVCQQMKCLLQRPNPHRRRNLSKSFRNSNIASASWCVLFSEYTDLFDSFSELIINPYLCSSGPSKINHRQSFIRGACASCVQTSRYGESA